MTTHTRTSATGVQCIFYTHTSKIHYPHTHVGRPVYSVFFISTPRKYTVHTRTTSLCYCQMYVIIIDVISGTALNVWLAWYNTGSWIRNGSWWYISTVFWKDSRARPTIKYIGQDLLTNNLFSPRSPTNNLFLPKSPTNNLFSKNSRPPPRNQMVRP